MYPYPHVRIGRARDSRVKQLPSAKREGSAEARTSDLQGAIVRCCTHSILPSLVTTAGYSCRPVTYPHNGIPKAAERNKGVSSIKSAQRSETTQQRATTT